MVSINSFRFRTAGLRYVTAKSLLALVIFAAMVPAAGYQPRAYAQTPGYHAKWISQNGYPTLRRLECYRFEVKFQNTGTETWYRGIVNLGTDRPQDRIPGFIREDRCTGQPSGWLKENRVLLVEESVPPGGIGTFVFWYTVPWDKADGTYPEYFRPVADGITWMEDWGVYWNVMVTGPAAYSAKWISQNGYPTLERGGCYRFEVRFENIGSATWYPSIVHLGTDRPQDRIPGFIREDRCTGQPSGWVSENRVALQEPYVLPGGTGTFVFWYTVPSDKAPGVYSEYFRPVADGYTWMEDWGVYWDVTVGTPSLSFQYPIADGWNRPVTTQGFGESKICCGHLGEDYGYGLGEPVKAAADGVVVYRYYTSGACGRKCNGGWGNTIVIKHADPTVANGIVFTQYSHLSRVDVQVNAVVSKGSIIGAVGRTGYATNYHLHFEVKFSSACNVMPPVSNSCLGPGYSGFTFSGDSLVHNGVTYYRPSWFVEMHR